MYGNGLPEHLEEEFLRWYEGYIATAHARSESSRALLGVKEQSHKMVCF